MRALLVVNPKATATSARVRDVLARALGSDLKVDVAETQRRAHAIELGARATQEGYDLVVALGGDGTVNEVVNGILGGDRILGGTGAPGPRTEQPALAVVPGGSTNVFSRALGIPRDPVEATGSLLDALREDRSRWIGLGRAESPGLSGRWFTFTAGMGLDADAVRMVERARAKGKPSTPSRYTRATLGRFLFGTDRRHGALTLQIPGEEPISGLFLGIAGNTTPWTYFRNHPITLTTTASFDTHLDLVVMRTLGITRTLWAASGMLTGRGVRGRSRLAFHDLREFTLSADRPMHFEVDGDYLGERETVRFVSVPSAIRIIC